jgi:hypothetical protein
VETDSPACPACGADGVEVPRRTVAAVTSTSLPSHQGLRLCRTSDCPLVYYGDAGAQIPTSTLSLLPLFKGGDVVCFCFLRRAHEIANGGRERVIEEISARVKAGDCSCDLRNPTGKCCLGEIRRSI